MEDGQLALVPGVSGKIDRTGEHEIGPVAGLLPQADPQYIKLVNAVKPAGRVAFGGAGLLSFRLIGDGLSALPVGFSPSAVLADVLALGK